MRESLVEIWKYRYLICKPLPMAQVHINFLFDVELFISCSTFFVEQDYRMKWDIEYSSNNSIFHSIVLLVLLYFVTKFKFVK